jgi:hypothetical protein
MLPDFPVLKAELHQLLVLGASAERPGRPEMSQLLVVLPRQPKHEGDRGILVRESGEEEEIPFSTYTAEDVLDLSEVDLPTLRETYDSFRDLASETDEQVSADQDELVNSTAESIGNVVEQGDRPLPDAILEGVEMMHLFGDPQNIDELFDLPQVRYTLREAPAQAVEEAREQMKNGAYKEQTEQLLQRKHEEHRVREGRRQLVG